jgi:hypothetical protein
MHIFRQAMFFWYSLMVPHESNPILNLKNMSGNIWLKVLVKTCGVVAKWHSRPAWDSVGFWGVRVKQEASQNDYGVLV